MPAKQDDWWLMGTSLLAVVLAGVAVWLVLPPATNPSAVFVGLRAPDAAVKEELKKNTKENGTTKRLHKSGVGVSQPVQRAAASGLDAQPAGLEGDRLKLAPLGAQSSSEPKPSWVAPAAPQARPSAPIRVRGGALLGGRQRDLSSPSETTGLTDPLASGSPAPPALASGPAPNPAVEEAVVPRPGPVLGPEEIRAARFVAHFPIGNSSTNEARHRVGWNLATEGWAGFVEKRVLPQLDAGVRRIMLHNPFGHRPGVVMQFDQFLEAEEAGLTWLTQGFAEAWEPLTHEGIEVIAYVGSPAHDERSQAFETVGDVAGFDAYARRCLQPLLDAGVSIAFDSAAIEPADTYTFRIAQWTRNRGVRTYIEPRPRAYLPHWFDYGIVTIYPFWLRTDPSRHPEIAGRHAANEDLTGDVIVLHNRPPSESSWQTVGQWLPSDIEEIYTRNLSPAVPFTYWLRWGGDDLESLIRHRPVTAFD